MSAVEGCEILYKCMFMFVFLLASLSHVYIVYTVSVHVFSFIIGFLPTRSFAPIKGYNTKRRNSCLEVLDMILPSGLSPRT